MVESQRDVPHFYVSADVPVDFAETTAARIAAEQGMKVTLSAILIRAATAALIAHPELNAVWDAGELKRIRSINIGVAIALEDGLVAPALLDCEGRSLIDLARALDDLASRARAGRLREAEVNDATFTVTNLGMFGVDSFSAIVIPPQVAILAAGRSRLVPRDANGCVAWRRVVSVTLSADHRALDGADVARFLDTFAQALEDPAIFGSDATADGKRSR
jgi:pyruvate dehydrogenase E2 component (dihydrolipoamide acetyltransferase)